MKKLLTLFTLLLTVCSGAWATDETPGNTGSSGTNLAGTSYTIAGTYIAGAGGKKVSPMVSKGVKVRLTASGTNNSLTIAVNSGYIINDLTIYAVTNTDNASCTVTSVKVDGTEAGNAPYTIAAKNASTASTIALTDIDATENIVLSFGDVGGSGQATQAHFDFHFTYSAAPTGAYKITKGEHNNGNFTISPSSADAGDVITLSANPNDGFAFNSWRIFKTGDTNTKVEPTSGDANTTFTMPAYDVTVDAQFVAIPFNITHAAAEHGTYTIRVASEEPVSGNTVGYIGQTVYLVATPDDGYALSAWNVTETVSGNAVTMKTANAFDMPTVDVTIAPTFVAAAAPTISVNATSLSTPQNVSVELTATATGSPNPTITWYQSATAVASGGTEKATGTSYSPDVTTIGTYYFYAVASNGVDPDAVSDVITFTVAPKLNSLVYTNGFKAFIQQPGAGNGKIKAYYIAGTDAPTVSSFTATTGATYNVEGKTLTLTAADGETTAVYDITLDPVTPYSGTGEYTFTAGDSWVKAGNNFSTGWKIARSYESDSEKKFMISTGSNRLYLFLAPSTSLTITQNGTKRDMLVSIDGGDAEVKSDATFTVTGKENAAYMVEISQKNSDGGDGKISKVNITKTGFESGIITASGWNTFSSSSKLDLSTIVGGKAYVATAKDNENVTLTETSAKVAAGTGLMIKGTPNAAFKIDTTNGDATYSGDNLLVGLPNGGKVTKNDDNYVFAWSTADVSTAGFYFVNDAEPTLGANKAYLHAEGVTPAKLGIIIDDSETDGIRSIENSELRIENSDYYNLAGQKVGADYKGIVIVNGKKVIRK